MRLEHATNTHTTEERPLTAQMAVLIHPFNTSSLFISAAPIAHAGEQGARESGSMTATTQPDGNAVISPSMHPLYFVVPPFLKQSSPFGALV